MSEANNNLNINQNFDKIIDETKDKLVDNQENINKLSQRDYNYENNNNEYHNNNGVNYNQNNLNNNHSNIENNEKNINYNYYNNDQNFNHNNNDENELSNLNIQKEINLNSKTNKNFHNENSLKLNLNKSKYDDLFSLENEQPSCLSFSNKNLNRLQLSMKSFQEDKKKIRKIIKFHKIKRKYFLFRTK